MSPLSFAVEAVTADEFIAVLQASTLAERRPVHDLECIENMLQYANLIVTARDKGKLIGIARSLTDFTYIAYLSDLAVDKHYQNKGVGKQLIRLTKEQFGPRCKLLLLSAPAAVDYYPHLGFEKHPQAWILPPERKLI